MFFYPSKKKANNQMHHAKCRSLRTQYESIASISEYRSGHGAAVLNNFVFAVRVTRRRYIFSHFSKLLAQARLLH